MPSIHPLHSQSDKDKAVIKEINRSVAEQLGLDFPLGCEAGVTAMSSRVG